MTDRLSRRQLLAIVGPGAMAGLAGCPASDGDSETSADGTPTPAPTTTTTPSGTDDPSEDSVDAVELTTTIVDDLGLTEAGRESVAEAGAVVGYRREREVSTLVEAFVDSTTSGPPAGRAMLASQLGFDEVGLPVANTPRVAAERAGVFVPADARAGGTVAASDTLVIVPGDELGEVTVQDESTRVVRGGRAVQSHRWLPDWQWLLDQGWMEMGNWVPSPNWVPHTGWRAHQWVPPSEPASAPVVVTGDRDGFASGFGDSVGQGVTVSVADVLLVVPGATALPETTWSPERVFDAGIAAPMGGATSGIAVLSDADASADSLLTGSAGTRAVSIVTTDESGSVEWTAGPTRLDNGHFQPVSGAYQGEFQQGSPQIQTYGGVVSGGNGPAAVVAHIAIPAATESESEDGPSLSAIVGVDWTPIGSTTSVQNGDFDRAFPRVRLHNSRGFTWVASGGEIATESDDSESDSQSPVLSLSSDVGVTTDSEGRVETWADQSGNGYDYAAGSQASRPTVTEDAVNGQPALAFDGEDDHLIREDTMGIPNDSARTFVVVCRLAETTPRSPFLVQGKPGSDTQFYGLEANTFDTAGEQFGVYAIGSAHDSNRETDTNYHVHTLRAESFSDQREVRETMTYYVDGVESPLNQVSRGEGPGTSFTGEATAIGSFPVEGTPEVTHSGQIAEVRVYDRALTESKRTQIEGNLMDKYRIGEPPATATPTVTLELPNGSTLCVSPVEGQSPVSEYYGFNEDETRSASTPAELAVDDATVSFLYRNGQTGNLSLVVIHGNANGTTDGGGKAIMIFDGVSGTEWLVQDGPPGNDAYTTPDGTLGASESASWSWPDDRADGGAIGTLGDGFEITLTHRQEGTVGDSSASRSGLDRWLFVDGSDIENPIELATLADAGDVSIGISSGCHSDG